MDSLAIKTFEQTIINYINSVLLPAECKRLVLEEILRQVERAADDEIRVCLEKEKEESNELHETGLGEQDSSN